MAEIDESTQEENGRVLSAVLFGRSPVAVSDLLADDPWVPQMVIYAASLASWRVMRGLGLRADVLLGHSLGEIAAPVCGGAYSVADGVRVVLRRIQALESLDTGAAYMAARSDQSGGVSAGLAASATVTRRHVDPTTTVNRPVLACPGVSLS